MKTEEIARLLEKYYNGESSEADELLLRRYFESENIPQEYEDEKVLFRYYSDNALIPEPSAGLGDRIISSLENSDERSRIPASRISLLTYSGIAAGLLLLIGSYFFFIRQKGPKDTFSNPELAYAETVKILYEVSSQFNRGTKQLGQIGKLEDATVKSFSSLNSSMKIIDKNLKNLDYFQKAINIVNSPVDFVVNK
jgi:hypothetical protein